MDEVEMGSFLDFLQGRVCSLDLDRIPAHMGNLKGIRGREGTRKGKGKPNHLSPENVQALGQAEFLAFRKEQLKTEADSQERPSAPDEAKDWIHEPQMLQILHGFFESPYPRQNQAIGLFDQQGILGHNGRESNLLETLGNAPQIPHAVVDDGDHSLPLVEGIPLILSSRETAWRRARPRALKRDSTMWCPLLP